MPEEMAVMECRGVTKYYGRRCALEDVNLNLESGKIVGLLGPNGSGKTTLIKLLNGLLVPYAGELFICGEPVGQKTKSLVSYLPDADYLPNWMDLHQLVSLFAGFFRDFDENRAAAMFSNLGLDPRQQLKTLSKGNREKVQLVLAMSRRARLYLLDEPIGGVDPAARDYILRTIIQNYEPDATVVISTHLIADVESVLDDVIFLRQGHVVLHKPSDQVREEYGKSVDAVFREVFAC